MRNSKRSGVRALDGDTILLRYALQEAKKIRLAGVNAPELGTRAGEIARYRLQKLIGNKPVTVQPVGRSYDRVVGVVRSGGRNINNAMKRYGY